MLVTKHPDTPSLCRYVGEQAIAVALAGIQSECQFLVTLPPSQAGTWEIQPATVAILHSLKFNFHSVIDLTFKYMRVCMIVQIVC